MILLDTHALLWFDRGDERLGPRTRNLIDEGLRLGEVAISTISIWEIGMLISKGRVRLDLDLIVWRSILRDQGLIEVSVTADIAERAATLQGMHGDPADRIIVATAQEDNQLVTADRHILEWRGDLYRVSATE